MMKLVLFWHSIRSSYWFLPGGMTLAAIVLSAVTLAIDSALGPVGSRQTAWLFAGGPEGARTMLAMLAASMLTIFGVVFSIMIVALVLASSQFGPRLIRTFLSDTVDQVAVGAFISTFVYCLLVARTVGSDGAQAFVPHASISVAILLALASLAVLIYFISHLSVSLQASFIIARVGGDLRRTIARELPEAENHAAHAFPAENQERFTSATVPVVAGREGYIQAIDYGQVVQVAGKRDLVARFTVCAGDFLVRGDEVALIPPAAEGNNDLIEAIESALVLGTDRTHEQDVEFPINQLVQLVVRALSPAINDPITAVMGIEQLRAGLCHIAERRSLSSVIRDASGAPRLSVKRQTPAHNIDAAFSLIRQYGCSNLEVTLSLLDALEQISRRTTDGAFRQALLRQAALVGDGAQSALPVEADRKQVAERLQQVVDVLQGANPPGGPSVAGAP